MEFEPHHLHDALARRPGSTAEQITAAAARQGVTVSQAEVEYLLFDDDDVVMQSAGDTPTWRLLDSPAPVLPPLSAAPPVEAPEPDRYTLRRWQVEALDAWRANGHLGIVEAVTGTGKTMVAIDAAREEIGQGGRVVVLVPTVELLHQWRRAFVRSLPTACVALLGDGQQPRRAVDVVIAIINSAADVGAERLLSGCGLLIADECHRYGAPGFCRALRSEHVRRLGLTATLERGDDGVAAVLLPYFGGVVHHYDFGAAKSDHTVIAPFRVALVGVPLLPVERAAYDESEAALKLAYAEVCRELDLDEVTIEDIAALAKVADGSMPANRGAQRYLTHRSERELLVATCVGKQRALMSLGPALTGSRSLVFVDRTESAERAASDLAQCGLDAQAVHSKLRPRERKNVMAKFREGELDVICAPKVLDEGVDVPEADLAVVLSASRSRRQMIQRMGRVLRVKDDGRNARFLIVYVTGTYEDPAVAGRHEAFLAMVTDVAEEVRTFDRSRPDDLLHFLRADPSTTAGSGCPGRHRASESRPSFFDSASNVRTLRARRRAELSTRAVLRPAVGQYQQAEVCAACNGPVGVYGQCRCS